MEKQEHRISILVNICKGVAEDSDAFFYQWYKVQKPKFKNYFKINLYWDLRGINLVPTNKVIMIYNAMEGLIFDAKRFKHFILVSGYENYERLMALYKKNYTAIVFCKEGEVPRTNRKINKKLLYSYFITDTLKDSSDKNNNKAQTICFIKNFAELDKENQTRLLERIRTWFYDINGSRNNLFEVVSILSNKFGSDIKDLKNHYINLQKKIIESDYFKITEAKKRSLCTEIINELTLPFNDFEYEYLMYLVGYMTALQNEFFEHKKSLNSINPFVKDILLKRLAHCI